MVVRRSRSRYGRCVALRPVDFDEPVRAAVLDAFERLRPQMLADAKRDADLDPASRIDDFSEPDLEQFLNAYDALMREALTDGGTATRDLILETALPPILELGQTPADMVRSNVISAVMLAHRLLPLVRPEQRDEAARWLASFYSTYAHELTGRALTLERERG
jgi:hypothetical protein